MYFLRPITSFATAGSTKDTFGRGAGLASPARSWLLAELGLVAGSVGMTFSGIAAVSGSGATGLCC